MRAASCLAVGVLTTLLLVPAPAQAAPASDTVATSARMTLQVTDVTAALRKVDRLAARLGGSAGGVHPGPGTGRPPRGDVALSLPDDALATALQHLARLGRVLDRELLSRDLSVELAENQHLLSLEQGFPSAERTRLVLASLRARVRMSHVRLLLTDGSRLPPQVIEEGTSTATWPESLVVLTVLAGGLVVLVLSARSRD